MSLQDEPPIIPVGIDIGSINARIAISSANSPPPSLSPSTILLPHCYRSPPPGIIVPNESGQRLTLAISTVEPKAEADLHNDPYWDFPAAKQKQTNRRKQKQVDEIKEYIFGEAARRSLQREKKPLESHRVRSLLDAAADTTAVENNGESGEVEQVEKELRDAARSFVSHLITQATNATHSHPSSLRLVLSTPDYAVFGDRTVSLKEGTDSNITGSSMTQELVRVTQEALIETIRKVGWESSPALTSAISSNKNMNKREKKAKINEFEAIPRVVGVITESMAVCYAHNLFQFTEYGPSWDHGGVGIEEEVKEDNGINARNHHLLHPPKDWKNVLVIDWGSSSLKITHLQRLGKLTPTQIISPKHTISDTSLSGHEILTILVRHVAELFERQPSCRRCGISAKQVLGNTKSRARLDQACEMALRTLSSSTSVRVAIDGLYDGMDCNVEVRKPRFDMLCEGLINRAELQFKEFLNRCAVVMDVVLSAGNVICMPTAATLVNRLFDHGKYWRGRISSDIPPEEVVAIGCSMFASTLTSAFLRKGLMFGGNDAGYDGDKCSNPLEANVPLCPVGVGLSMLEGDPASVVLIESGTPLPASISRNVDVTGCFSGSLVVVQIGCLEGCVGAGKTNSNIEEKIIGRIHGIPKGLSEVQVSIFLSVEGRISICVDDGPIVSF